MLSAAWAQLHPGEPLPPPCTHSDPVRVLVADLDPRPGAELALASLRFGVVVLGADGAPLASKPLGCGDAHSTAERHDEVVALDALAATSAATHELVLRTRAIGHCGAIGTYQLLSLRNGALLSIFATDDQSDRSCGRSPREQFSTRVEVAGPGVLRVTVDGTTRAWLEGGGYGPPAPLHRSTRHRVAE